MTPKAHVIFQFVDFIEYPYELAEYNNVEVDVLYFTLF